MPGGLLRIWRRMCGIFLTWLESVGFLGEAFRVWEGSVDEVLCGRVSTQGPSVRELFRCSLPLCVT
jgi:hypothetical protein